MFLAGGRGVIEGLGSQLKLSKRQLEPSFASLYFYGNTSSASYFYGVGFAENKQGIKKGERLWQVWIFVKTEKSCPDQMIIGT